jgi:hypothetical protein
MASDAVPLETRITVWAFTHPRSSLGELMEAFSLSYAEASAMILRVHAILDALMEQYPDPRDFAEYLLACVHEQPERGAGDGG